MRLMDNRKKCLRSITGKHDRRKKRPENPPDAF